MEKIVEWSIPIHTVSEANCSEHWTKKKKRHDLQKKWIWAYFKRSGTKIPLPCHIKLTRLGKKLLDSDNLPVSMKWVRDSIADQLIPGMAAGRADDDSRITWQYSQEISSEYFVVVTFFG
jgi:hypothetical protein